MGDTWTPREGAYGRTRDGRRVGPLYDNRKSDDHRNYAWKCLGVEYIHRSDGKDGPYNAAWCVDGRFYETTTHPLDLVAEWIDSPVRIVTRREIVPGTYGTVAVGDVTTNGNAVAISVGSGHYTPDELDAAARVLTQLAGALRDGQ
jgi:hypothetical protein